MTQAEFLNASETHGQHGYRLLSKSEPFTVTANEASTLFSQVTETLGIRKKKEPGLTFHSRMVRGATPQKKPI